MTLHDLIQHIDHLPLDDLFALRVYIDRRVEALAYPDHLAPDEWVRRLETAEIAILSEFLDGEAGLIDGEWIEVEAS